MLQAASIIQTKNIQSFSSDIDELEKNSSTSNTNKDEEDESEDFNHKVSDYLNRKIFFHWEFHPKGLEKSRIRNIYRDELQNRDNFKGGMTIALSRPKNLRDTITRTTMKEPDGIKVSEALSKFQYNKL
jgi:hypothetical protein